MNTFEEELRRLAEVSAKEFVDQINKDINLKNKIQTWYQKDYKLENIKEMGIYHSKDQLIIINIFQQNKLFMITTTMGHLLDILK